jgi:hypothetical protein
MISVHVDVELDLPADPPPLSYPARQVLITEGGPLIFVPLTPAQLEVALDALGSHAGRLADSTDAPSDAYVPFASLQSYLARFQQEVP